MPSKNNTAKAELTRQNRLASGPLSERYPQVSSIVIRMTYYQKGSNPILMLRTIHVAPSDPSYFVMDCMIKDCEGGGFDLSEAIARMIREHKKTGKGRLDCCGKTDPETPDHASVAYEIAIEYRKKSR